MSGRIKQLTKLILTSDNINENKGDAVRPVSIYFHYLSSYHSLFRVVPRVRASLTSPKALTRYVSAINI